MRRRESNTMILSDDSERIITEYLLLYWRGLITRVDPDRHREYRGIRRNHRNLHQAMTPSEREIAISLMGELPDVIADLLGDHVVQGTPEDSQAIVQGRVPEEPRRHGTPTQASTANQTGARSSSAQASTANQAGASSSSAQASTGPSRLGTATAVQNPIPDGYNSRLTQSSGIIPRPRRVVSDEEIEQVNQDYVPLERQPLPDVYRL
jgi:hypothetical protein